jgi:tetratricopeptide (TPR) repeat protein
MELAQYDFAESLLRSALELRQEIFGKNHPDVVESLSSLSQLAMAKGDFESAESFLRRQVSISRNFEGRDRLHLAGGLNDLAIVVDKKREDSEAVEELYQESLSIYREILGNESHAVAIILGNLAVQAHWKGDYEKAESRHREALRIERKLVGKEHPDIALSMHNLAFLLYDKGEYANAESLLRDALAINIKAYGESHPSMTSYLGNLAMILVALKRYVEAERFFQEATKVNPEVLKIDVLQLWGPWSAERKSSYGELLTKLGRYEEAERYLSTALDKLKNRFGENDKRIRRPLIRLIGLYETWGKPEKAAEYRGLLKKNENKK